MGLTLPEINPLMLIRSIDARGNTHTNSGTLGTGDEARTWANVAIAGILEGFPSFRGSLGVVFLAPSGQLAASR